MCDAGVQAWRSTLVHLRCCLPAAIPESLLAALRSALTARALENAVQQEVERAQELRAAAAHAVRCVTGGAVSEDDEIVRGEPAILARVCSALSACTGLAASSEFAELVALAGAVKSAAGAAASAAGGSESGSAGAAGSGRADMEIERKQ